MSQVKRPLHTRPFDLADASEGAPYALECGWPVSLAKFHMRDGGAPILGFYGEAEAVGRWHANGKFAHTGHHGLNLVMTPVCMVEDRPAFVGDVLIIKGSTARVTIEPATDPNYVNCMTWPDDAPEPSRPARDAGECAVRAKLIQQGWLDPDQIASRDLTIAHAVSEAILAHLANASLRKLCAGMIEGIDLPAVISKVKP